MTLRPKSVDDAIPGNPDQPRADLLNRTHQPGGLDQLEKHVLQDVLGVRDVTHPALDEALQPAGLAGDDLRDVSVLFNGVEVADQ